jgi:probable F420-dependent oxidoreductase
VRLGIHLPQFRAPVSGEDLASFARDAEAAGADDLWVSDHVILPAGSIRPPESFHDPLTILTWAAAATSRVGLGTSVLVAPYRHPVLLAKSIASLDAISGGRVILGVGSGWMEREFAALGVPYRERGRRTDDAIAVCRALWRGDESIAWPGGRLDGLTIRPLPTRPGGPPVWVGGDSDAGIARAVRLGDAWHTTVSDPKLLPDRVATLEAALAAAARPREGFTLSVRVRGDLDRLRLLAPRLRDLGVDHVLVDHPDEDPATTVARVGALREII